MAQQNCRHQGGVGVMQLLPSQENRFYPQHIACLLNSYLRLLGKPLLQGEMLAQQAFEAPFALLSHDAGSDPLFNYANRTALNLFELDWPQLISMPSRLSAEPMNQQARAELLAQVGRQGYIDHYSGVRIGSRGKRFQIDHAVVWNVYQDDGRYYGQAACFADWRWL
jgi:MEKHLA domain